MLFGNYERAGIPRRTGDRVAVERLDRMEIDHTRRDSLRLESLLRLDRLRKEQAGCDNRNIGAVNNLVRPPDLELFVRSVHNWRLHPSGSDEHRPVMRGGGPH